MLDHTLRVWKDESLRPFAFQLRRISPNWITCLAMLVGLFAAWAGSAQSYWLGLGLWLLNRLLDGLDGAVARTHDRQSDFGGYLDILLDFVVYAAVPIGLYLGNPGSFTALALILLLSTFYVNAVSWLYLSAILEKRALGADANGEMTTVTMPAALIGGTETFLFYCAFFIWPDILPWSFGVMAAFVLVGIGQRLWWGWRALRPGD